MQQRGRYKKDPFRYEKQAIWDKNHGFGTKVRTTIPSREAGFWNARGIFPYQEPQKPHMNETLSGAGCLFLGTLHTTVRLNYQDSNFTSFFQGE